MPDHERPRAASADAEPPPASDGESQRKSGPPADRRSSPGKTLSAETVKRRASFGVIILALRSVLMQLTILGGGILLARLLSPADFGVFAVVQFALAFFSYLGDAGVGAALVQQKETPSQQQLSSVFWLQVLLSAGVVLVVWAVAGGVGWIWPDIPTGTSWLLRTLAIALLLTSLRVIPSILMERELLFGRLAVLDLVNHLSFYGVAIALAALGFGAWAMVGGVLAESVVLMLVAYALRPWHPRWLLDWPLIRPLVRFGLPFQAKNLVGFINGAVAPVYAGAKLGDRALGFINWAQGIAYTPLKIVEIMARVTFPLFSRLQHDPGLLSRELGKSIRICAIATMGYSAMLIGLGEPIIRVIYTDKWMPALPLLYIYAAVIAIGFLAPIVASALDALGRPSLFLRLSIGWTALAWLVVPLTTPKWGMIGFVAGFCVHVVVGNIAVIVVVRKLIPQARLWPSVRASLVGAVASGALARLVFAPHAAGWLTLIPSIAATVVVFLGLVLLMDRGLAREVRGWLRRLRAPADVPGEAAAPSAE
jgi:PST family polysaccharide transporter